MADNEDKRRPSNLTLLNTLGDAVRTWGLIVVAVCSAIGGATLFVSRLARSADVQAVSIRVDKLETWQESTDKHNAWVEDQLLNIAGAVGAKQAPKK